MTENVFLLINLKWKLFYTWFNTFLSSMMITTSFLQYFGDWNSINTLTIYFDGLLMLKEFQYSFKLNSKELQNAYSGIWSVRDKCLVEHSKCFVRQQQCLVFQGSTMILKQMALFMEVHRMRWLLIMTYINLDS